MMAGHLLHSGGEGGIGEERHKLPSETCVSYWVRLADTLILTGIRHWQREWRQWEDNKMIQCWAEFESVCLCADFASESEITRVFTCLSVSSITRVTCCESVPGQVKDDRLQLPADEIFSGYFTCDYYIKLCAIIFDFCTQTFNK